MTSIGHTAASYLLARSSQLLGYPITTLEVEVLLVAGNITDLDVLAGPFLGKTGDKHHDLATHTPAAVLIIVLMLILFTKINLIFIFLIALALLLHLVLDNISYWFFMLKLQENSSYPQINWLYPLKKSDAKTPWIKGYKNVLKVYFTKARVTLFLEVILVLVATTVFLTSR